VYPCAAEYNALDTIFWKMFVDIIFWRMFFVIFLVGMLSHGTINVMHYNR
jgi:hypothetical protein